MWELSFPECLNANVWEAFLFYISFHHNLNFQISVMLWVVQNAFTFFREYFICLNPNLSHTDGNMSSLMEAKHTHRSSTNTLGNIQTDDDLLL